MKSALLSLLLATGAAGPVLAQSLQPVRVVELFTSQGCSSCPPANRFVAKLAEDDPQTLALSYGVTYWDYLGWTDTFGDPEFTARQRAYRDTLPSKMYTPQIVVNGTADSARWKRRAVQAHELDRAVKLERSHDGLSLSGDVPDDALVALVSYTPGQQEVAVKRGENGGRTLSLANVVTGIEYREWSGRALAIELPDEAIAALVHDRQSGDIVAAADWRISG